MELDLFSRCWPGEDGALAPPAAGRAGSALPLPYDEAVIRVREALGKQGFGVLSEIDVRATLDSGDGDRWWNLAPHIGADQRYSRVYRGRRELIDHLMVSHALLEASHPDEVTAGPDEAPSITDNQTKAPQPPPLTTAR